MNRSPVLTTLLLSIGLISATAQSAENVNADLTTGLNQVGVISVQGCGRTSRCRAPHCTKSR